MTAELIPEAPTYATESEHLVGRRLVEQLPDGSVVFAGLRFTGTYDHEVDFLCLIPDSGIVVVEVKGGSVHCTHGQWYVGAGESRREFDIEQGLRNKYAVRDYLECDERWQGHSRLRIEHVLVTPYTDWPDDFHTPGLERWQVLGRREMGRLGERLRGLCTAARGGRVPTAADVALVRTILRGAHHPVEDVEADAAEREGRADRLTKEQALLLDITRFVPRTEVRGCAGSGKTILALTQAKQLARGHGGLEPQRVALVCYSIGLAEYFRRELNKVGRRHRPAFIGTFAALGRSWGAPDGSREDSDFWEHRLPEQMLDLAGGLAREERFDAVIVDEGQDFADSWWRPLLAALRDEETGRLHVYSDEQQRVFQRFGRPPVTLVPLVLDHNLRNTKQIAETFLPLAGARMELRGEDGPRVECVPVRTEDAIAAADDQVDRLLDEGWDPAHVMLLTTGKRHDVQVERQQAYGQQGYWRTFWDGDDVFYGHVLGCKGLERRAVILCLNEDGTRDRAKERLYVGLSRATDRLVVVGDPAVIRAMGGDEVARRLGL
ncbi:nuclease-related domain-containing DEAD/DEAH box helicase [Raineyella sp.]|uniref:NERD domain-containing protein n=1 Tax=bioreactor metagenome TaxID=1076179 RepID=A0A644ZGF7_9ZZZZ|nr:NERD domain-containing protein [Raineyella sp.]MEA5155367.1 NERD domain-containing protein [Raineyella sp.]